MLPSGFRRFVAATLISAFLVPVVPARAAVADDDAGYFDDVPTTLITQQRLRFGDTPDSEIDVFLASGDSLAALLEDLGRVVGAENVRKAPFLGFVRDGTDRAEIDGVARLLGENSQQVFSVDEAEAELGETAPETDVPAEGEHASAKPAVSRAIASEDPEPLTRIDLIRRLAALEAKVPAGKLTEYVAAGDRIIGDAYNRSARRWTMVFVRAAVAGGAMAIGVSTLPMGISIPLIAATMGVSGFFMAKADWMAKFVGYRTAVEQKFIDLAQRFLPRRKSRGKGFAVKAGSPPKGPKGKAATAAKSAAGKTGDRVASGFVAAHVKWGGIEMTANTAIKLVGHTAFSVAAAEIPKPYQVAGGLQDALVLTGETVITQGVYEIVINHEFERRNRAYHALIAYATEALLAEKDPIAIRELERTIASCRRLGLRERVIRSVFLTLGTASWALASALRVLPDPIYAKISSYSLLGAAGLLKSYYFVRKIHEERILQRPDIGYLADVRLRVARMLNDLCTSLLRKWYGLRNWLGLGLSGAK